MGCTGDTVAVYGRNKRGGFLSAVLLERRDDVQMDGWMDGWMNVLLCA